MCRDSRGGAGRRWTHCMSEPNSAFKAIKKINVLLTVTLFLFLFWTPVRERPWSCSANSERNPEVWILHASFHFCALVMVSPHVKINLWLSFSFSRSDQRLPGDSQEVVCLVDQAIQFYEKKLRDFYTHLRFPQHTCYYSTPVHVEL